MSLHSSYKDFRDYQISNVYFESLKKTPPSRLHYFFTPELDYNGYINVVRDQEEIQHKKQIHTMNLAQNRKELRRKHCKRMMSREVVEKQIGMKHARTNSSLQQFAAAQGLQHGEELHKSVMSKMRRNQKETTGGAAELGIKLPAHERWQVSRKAMLDKGAIAMIEARMQQEANEIQLMEGWRAAARNTIRDKFVETRHRNSVVERHMDFMHTRDRLAPSEANDTQGFGGNNGHDYSQTAPELSLSNPEMEDPYQQTSTSALTLPEVKGAIPPAEDALELPPELPLTPGEKEEKHYADEAMDEIDDFTATIDAKKVKTNQRMRSLALDSTKTWTRPMPNGTMA